MPPRSPRPKFAAAKSVETKAGKHNIKIPIFSFLKVFVKKNPPKYSFLRLLK